MREYSTYCVALYAVALLSSVHSTPTHAQPKPQHPVEIRSDHLNIDTKTQRATLSGNVLVRHQSMTLSCATLHVVYDPQGQPLEMTAQGAVKVSYKDIFLTSKEAKYTRKPNAPLRNATLTLSGSPTAVQRASKLRAQSITIELHTGRIRAAQPQGSLPLLTSKPNP